MQLDLTNPIQVTMTESDQLHKFTQNFFIPVRRYIHPSVAVHWQSEWGGTIV